MTPNVRPMCGYCKRVRLGMLFLRRKYICPECVLHNLKRLPNIEPDPASVLDISQQMREDGEA